MRPQFVRLVLEFLATRVSFQEISFFSTSFFFLNLISLERISVFYNQEIVKAIYKCLSSRLAKLEPFLLFSASKLWERSKPFGSRVIPTLRI